MQKVKHSLSKLEKDSKKLKERETTIKNEFKEIETKIKEDAWSFKMPLQHYTPGLRNYYERQRALEEPSKSKYKLF